MKATLTIIFWTILAAALGCLAKVATYAPTEWSLAAGTLGLLAAFTYSAIPNELPHDDN